MIIGGGAAGFFASIHAKATKNNLRVVIAEKSGKLLSKVLVSGGGRCNVTHNQTDNAELLMAYPRGRSLLKWALRKWSVTNTIRWFETHGVELKTEADGRMFPATDSSQTIANAILDSAEKLGVEVHTGLGLEKITVKDDGFHCLFNDKSEWISRRVIIATGGFPKKEQFDFITSLGIEIEDPVPSLFTFNIPDKDLHALMGISTIESKIKIESMPDWYEGPVLITHWGLSGPAVLKASSYLAKELHAANYKYTILVDWSAMGEETAREVLDSNLLMNSAKKLINTNPFDLPGRLWEFILQRSKVSAEKICRDLSKKEKNQILEQTVRCKFKANGKTTFKEEFVTAGGVITSEIDHDTMQSKKIKGLYFAGEVINMDGITGGFNFQAAWATGYLAGSSAAK